MKTQTTNPEKTQMNAEIWNWLHDDTRIALLVRCGWTNKAGMLTPMGRRIYKTAWVNLSEAARNVLSRHYINIA